MLRNDIKESSVLEEIYLTDLFYFLHFADFVKDKIVLIINAKD